MLKTPALVALGLVLAGCANVPPNDDGLPSLTTAEFQALLVGSGRLSPVHKTLTLEDGHWEINSARGDFNGYVYMHNATLKITNSELGIVQVGLRSFNDKRISMLEVVDSTLSVNGLELPGVRVQHSTVKPYTDNPFDLEAGVDGASKSGSRLGEEADPRAVADFTDSTIGPIGWGKMGFDKLPTNTTLIGRSLEFYTLASRELDFSTVTFDATELVFDNVPEGKAESVPPIVEVRGLTGRISEIFFKGTPQTYRLLTPTFDFTSQDNRYAPPVPHLEASSVWVEVVGDQRFTFQPYFGSSSLFMPHTIQAEQCVGAQYVPSNATILDPSHTGGPAVVGTGHWLNITRTRAPGNPPAFLISLYAHVDGQVIPYLDALGLYRHSLNVKIPLLDRICMEDGQPPVPVDGFDIHFQDYDEYWGCTHFQPETTDLDLVMVQAVKAEDMRICPVLQNVLGTVPPPS